MLAARVDQVFPAFVDSINVGWYDPWPIARQKLEVGQLTNESPGVRGGGTSRTQVPPPFDVRKIVASPLGPPPTAVQTDELGHEMPPKPVGPAAKSRVCQAPDVLGLAGVATWPSTVACGTRTPAITAAAATQALSDGCMVSPKIADNDGPY